MKWNWRLFIGGKGMFWTSLILMILLLCIFCITYIINPTEKIYMTPTKMNPASIQKISEQYVDCLGIKIDKPIRYRFVKYKLKTSDDKIILGTFHEWNGIYYIDISIDLYQNSSLAGTVIHETRHMIVEYLHDKKIINLLKYTEDIAEERTEYYNNLFDCSVCVLKEKEKEND